MADCINIVIEADVGATAKSPNFFSTEEVIEPSATIADIEAGILDGTYTPIDPDLYTYEGKVRADYGQSEVTTLNLGIETVTIEGTPEGDGTDTYDVVNFKILPDVTGTWENKEHCLRFDIKRTLKTDPTEVDIWVKGTIKILPVITL